MRIGLGVQLITVISINFGPLWYPISFQSVNFHPNFKPLAFSLKIRVEIDLKFGWVSDTKITIQIWQYKFQINVFIKKSDFFHIIGKYYDKIFPLIYLFYIFVNFCNKRNIGSNTFDYIAYMVIFFFLTNGMTTLCWVIQNCCQDQYACKCNVDVCNWKANNH
jgi:hypothetical protein